MKGTLSELHRRGNDVQRKGWTNNFIHFLIDSLWRDEIWVKKLIFLFVPLAQKQADWNQANEEAPDYIKNKPTIPDTYMPLQVTGLTLVAVGWTLVSGLYEYDLEDVNITATSIVEVIPANADIDIVKAAEILPETDSSAGSVKIYSTNEPAGDISVTINIFEATT